MTIGMMLKDIIVSLLKILIGSFNSMLSCIDRFFCLLPRLSLW